MADTLRERLIRTAYLDLAAEHGLTIMPGSDGLPVVPSHWREQAEQHATTALAPAACPDRLDDGLRDYACGKPAGHDGSCGEPAAPSCTCTRAFDSDRLAVRHRDCPTHGEHRPGPRMPVVIPSAEVTAPPRLTYQAVRVPAEMATMEDL